MGGFGIIELALLAMICLVIPGTVVMAIVAIAFAVTRKKPTKKSDD